MERGGGAPWLLGGKCVRYAGCEDAPRPDAEQLVLLLLEALPEGSRIRDALDEIREAAEHWANELRNHIATACEARGEHQTATNQLEAADAIISAENLLGV